jgi:acetyl-CoA C-acetyltransferase
MASSFSPRSPRAERRALVVGVAQQRRKPELDGPWDPRDPAHMMADVIGWAAKDAGDGQLVQEADLLACVDPLAWAYDDLPARVGELAGTTGPASPHPPEAIVAAPGGNSPCELLNGVATRIVDGESRIALIAGAEAVYSRRRAMKEGIDLTQRGWIPYQGHRDFLKGQRPLTNEIEARHGMTAPIHCYPLYENALRAETGRTVDEHQRFLGELMAAHAAVAATNPYAWFPIAYTPDEIRTVTPDNRAVCFPYPKRMNAIIEVDQAAALVVMSSDEADRRGIPDSQRVAFLGGGSATDAWTPTERASMTSSPGYRAAATAALEHAGLYSTEVELFDLYSCFPSAVEFAMKVLSLAIDDPRPRTVTGGLAYAGGPGNSYSMHALAAMVERLRTTGSKVGFVSALGMTATKHAVSVLSSDPARMTPASGRATSNLPVPDKVRCGPPLIERPAAGPATIETYTVEYGHDGLPVRSIIVLRLADGRRTIANGELADVAALVNEEGVGKRGWVESSPSGANHFTLSAPPQ